MRPCRFFSWCFGRLTSHHSTIHSHTHFTYVTPDPLLDAMGLELLHHYANRASLTLSTENTLSIWQESVPAEAKAHRFLMHSLLAVSALHLSYAGLDKREAYALIANRQYKKALDTFRLTVGAINCTNGNAVTAFSFLTVVFSVGVPLVSGFSRTPNPTSAFIDILQVLRQAHVAVSPVLSGVMKGALGPLIESPPGGGKSCAMHEKGREVLDALKPLIEQSTETEEHRIIYTAALLALKTFAANMQDVPPSWANCLSWPIWVSPEFFQLLQDKQPMALVLIAYWSVPVYRSPNLWFNTWAKIVVADIWTMLDGQWKLAVTWPAEQVGFIPRELHEQPCLCLQCCVCAYCSKELRAYNQPQQCLEKRTRLISSEGDITNKEKEPKQESRLTLSK